MADYDLVIRNGVIADGTGSALEVADVGVRAGIIAEIGPITGSSTRVIEADGLLVTPGFIDVHTHYDGQATWDPQLAPSSWHGVTTVVMGNCGVGFAPIRSEDCNNLIQLMEGVEDIPGTALHEGLSWEWESFAEYLDVVDQVPHDVDVAAMVPHAPLRLYVMRDRARWDEPARPVEIARMAELAADAVRAGAIGFSTSRTAGHRSSDGHPISTLEAGADELVAIAEAVGSTRAGVLQVVSDFADVAFEFGLLREMARRSGRPTSFSLVSNPVHPERCDDLLRELDSAREAGLDIRAQVASRGIGMVMGLETTLNPFSTNPVYAAIADLPLGERVRRMSDPAFRSRLLAASTGEYVETQPIGRLVHLYRAMFELADPPDYEPDPRMSIAARAERAGVHPEELIYDVLTSDGGRGLLYVFIVNFHSGGLGVVHEMLSSPHSVVGLGDGGAHVGLICDASFPTTLLAHWGRDRSHDRFPLPYLVSHLTRRAADAVGLVDRGVVEPGRRADLNIIDFQALRARRPFVDDGLPGGERRLLQRADGYRHTFVAGVETYCNGEPTGNLPGRLVRARGPNRTGQRGTARPKE